MVLNATKLGTYDVVKTAIKKAKIIPEGLFLQFVCASTAGFFFLENKVAHSFKKNLNRFLHGHYCNTF
jgi:hypothetical protein